MSLAEIEAELEKMAPDELRQLALRAWGAFVQKEDQQTAADDCSEDDPALLAALDDAIARADLMPARAFTGEEIRERLREWTSSK